MRTWKWMVTGSLLIALGSMAAGQSKKQKAAQQQAASEATQSADPASAQAGAPTTLEQVVDRAMLRERALINMLKNRTPLVETYLQDLKNDPDKGPQPVGDEYFFGRIDMSDSGRRDYLNKGTFQGHLVGGVSRLFQYQYNPAGFSWMVFVDREDFDHEHYDFRYVHREFLGDVRCIVFDVQPKPKSGKGRFQGRIWVEDQDFNIVRLNGTYVPRPANSFFFHMDSWRVNIVPGFWVPAYVYSEEGDFSYGSKDKFAFKAQTRIWGYNVKSGNHQDEMTQVLVDSVKDLSPSAQDASPLQAERAWQQQAEDNVVERLQDAGLLAPSGELDKILQTVVSNIQITNNIDLTRPVKTRVLLTSPLETFSVGDTIVISRGLIDVLPDEGSLAMVLSHELAHIVLGHNLGSKFAFDDRMLFSDDATYRNMGFRHSPEDEAAADKKALEMLKNSPYATKLDTAGLFLRQLQERGPVLQALLTAHLGNGLTDNKGQVTRFTALLETAPKLDPSKLDQIAALPLGGRVKMNVWNDNVEMVKTPPIAITSARDKMPLEVTPFFPRLTRLSAGGGTSENTAASNTTGQSN